MASYKKNYVGFKNWEGRQVEEYGYIRLTESQLFSAAMMKLSGAAFRVYVYMRQHEREKRDFEFSRSKYIKFMTPPTFIRAVKELEEAGFIEVLEHNKHRQKPNRYRFSTKWRESPDMRIKKTKRRSKPNTETARADDPADSFGDS